MEVFDSPAWVLLVWGAFIATIGFIDLRRGPKHPDRTPRLVARFQPWLSPTEFHARQREGMWMWAHIGLFAFGFGVFLVALRIVVLVFGW